jgi:O-antigen/teichoic acid export membrane protein
MLSKLKFQIKSDFTRNLATMMSGAVIGQLVTLIAMPILSRLYSPSDFGLFAVLFSTISILGYIAGGTFETAIILPKENESALKLLKLSITIAIIFSALVAISLPFIPKWVYKSLGQENLESYIWIIPLGIILLSLVQAFTYYHNRQKNYIAIASNKVIQNSSVAVINISGGIIKPSVLGLIGGYIAGQIVSVALLYKKAKINITSIKQVKLGRIAKEYVNFPMFLAPMLLLNTFSVNILVYLFSIYFDQATVGMYSQAIKAINYPLYFITASFSGVYYQKLNESGNRKTIYIKSVFYSILIGFIMLLPVMIWGEELFVFVFGKEWSQAGQMATILCPLTILSFAVRNVNDTFSVTKKNHLLLIWQIIYLLTAVGIVYLFKDQGIKVMLLLYSIICSAMYLILAILGYTILNE